MSAGHPIVVQGPMVVMVTSYGTPAGNVEGSTRHEFSDIGTTTMATDSAAKTATAMPWSTERITTRPRSTGGGPGLIIQDPSGVVLTSSDQLVGGGSTRSNEDGPRQHDESSSSVS